MSYELLCKLGNLNARLEQWLRRQVGGTGLSLTQAMVLQCLVHQEGTAVCAADLHVRLGLSKACVSTALKSLKTGGYLRLDTDPADERRKKIRLNDKAVAACKALDTAFGRQADSLCASLTPARRCALERDLDCMLQTLGQITKEDVYDENHSGADQGI